MRPFPRFTRTLLVVLIITVVAAVTPLLTSAQHTAMSRITNITTLWNEGIFNAAVIHGGKGFFATFTFPGKVVKVDLATMTREGVLETTGFGNFKNGLVICGFAYFPCHTNPGSFVKIDLRRFEVTSSGVSQDTSEFSLVAPVTYGDSIFFGTETAPAKIVEFRLGSLERIRATALGESLVRSGVSMSRVAYFTLEGASSVGIIIKFDLHTMTTLQMFQNTSVSKFASVIAAFSPGLFAADRTTAAAGAAERFLFVGSGTVPGAIFKFDVSANPSSVTLVDTFSPSPYWLVDAANVRGSIFFLQTSDTGRLYRNNGTHLGSHAHASHIDGEAGEDFNVFVTDGRYGYVATNSNPGGIIKYDLGINGDPAAQLAAEASGSNATGIYNDSYGVATLDINHTSCIRRGTYIGRGYSVRLHPSGRGFLEARYDTHGRWGLTCDDYMSAHTATAICRMLNFNTTWATWKNRRTFDDENSGSGSDSISRFLDADGHTVDPSSPMYVDDLECPSGSVRNIRTCTVRDVNHDGGPHNCASDEAVILDCNAQHESGIRSGNYEFRLAQNGRLDVRPYSSSSSSSQQQPWGTMCSEGFSHFTASGLCRILGYPGVGYLAHFRYPSEDAGSGPIYLSNVVCPATAQTIDDCTYTASSSTSSASCNAHESDVALFCNGSRAEGTYVGNSIFLRTAGTTDRLEMRSLTDNNNDVSADNSIGWRTVCRGAGFNTRTAQALCNMLSGYGYESRRVKNYVSLFTEGNGSASQHIGMSNIDCFGSTDVRNFGLCTFHAGSCGEKDDGSPSGHEEDVGVLCDAEVKGVRSGSYFFRTLPEKQNVVQARPAPTFTASSRFPNISAWGTMCSEGISTTATVGATLCAILGNWGAGVAVNPSVAVFNTTSSSSTTAYLSNVRCSSPSSSSTKDTSSSLFQSSCTFASSIPVDDACTTHQTDVGLVCDSTYADAGAIDGAAIAGFVVGAVIMVGAVAVLAGVLIGEWTLCGLLTGGVVVEAATDSDDDDDDAKEDDDDNDAFENGKDDIVIIDDGNNDNATSRAAATAATSEPYRQSSIDRSVVSDDSTLHNSPHLHHRIRQQQQLEHQRAVEMYQMNPAPFGRSRVAPATVQHHHQEQQQQGQEQQGHIEAGLWSTGTPIRARRIELYASPSAGGIVQSGQYASGGSTRRMLASPPEGVTPPPSAGGRSQQYLYDGGGDSSSRSVNRLTSPMPDHRLTSPPP